LILPINRPGISHKNLKQRVLSPAFLKEYLRIDGDRGKKGKREKGEKGKMEKADEIFINPVNA